MTNIAAHVRIFDLTPDDDLVTKRIVAIRNLAAYFKEQRSVQEIFQLANDLALGVEAKTDISAALTATIETAIRKSAEAFVADGQGLQVTVCGLLGALESLDAPPQQGGNLAVPDVFAIGIWSALS